MMTRGFFIGAAHRKEAVKIQDSEHIPAVLRICGMLLAIAALFLALKYLLPLFAPFLLSFLTAAAIEPGVRYLAEKHRIKRRFASAALSLLALLAVGASAVLLFRRAVYELTGVMRDLPEMLSGLPHIISTLEAKAERYIVTAPPEVRTFLESSFSNLSKKAAELPAELTGKLLSLLSELASVAPKAILAAVTYIIGVFFISGSYGEIKAFLLRQIPARHRETAISAKSGAAKTLLKWLKAQITLMCITFLELTAAFLLLRIDYAVFLALFTALVDALPVLGVGTVLLPWAAVMLIAGRPGRAAALAVAYCVVTVVRSFLEPRIVGGMFGVHQAAMLTALYVGFCLLGVYGVIAVPLLLVLLSHLSDSGYIRLWKR